MITLAKIEHAQRRIAPYIRRTPTLRNETLSRRLGAHVYLKYELFQKTGSFKPRGVFNKMLRLSKKERGRGVVAIGGGNFAQAVAYAGSTLGAPTRIPMPASMPRHHREATQAYGGQIELVADFPAVIQAAEGYRTLGWHYFHAWDDPQVMEGYGTIGLELLEDVPELTDVVISVGGGALMSGITVAVKGRRPQVRVWTVETQGADVMARALQEGRVVYTQPTSLARGLSAPYVAQDALRIAQRQVEEHVLVSDRDAYLAQRFLLERAKVLTELAASCTLAAAEQLRDRFSADSHIALVLSGGNVSLDDLAEAKRQLE